MSRRRGAAPGAIEETPPLLERVRAFLVEHYAGIDTRSVGLFRIVFGFLLAANTVRLWAERYWLYDNDGVLPNHVYLFRPNGTWHFSLFLSFSTPAEVNLAFGLTTLVFVLFMIGWRARLLSVVSFVLVTSLDSRLILVENGGYVVVNLLASWAMFLPTDARFSVDAWLRGRRMTATTVDALNERSLPPGAAGPYRSAIHAALLLNLALIYFLNTVNKAGNIWRAGDTVHYVLHLDRMITGLGAFWREHLDFLTKPLSWWVLSVEALLAPLILAPKGKRLARPLAHLLMISIHLPFGVFMRLGPFSWAMITWGLLLWPTELWDELEAWYRRGARAVTVTLADRPLAWSVARLVARLDRLGLVTFEVADADAPLLRVPGGAFRDVVRALPGGRLAYPALNALSLGAFGRAFDLAERHEPALARFFGLPRPAPATGPEEPGLYAQRAGRGLAWLREALIVYLMIGGAFQAWSEGKGLPKFLQLETPKPWEGPLHTFRLFQGWGMFSANPITDDGSVSVDAITVDGRHVDPFTGAEPDLDLTDARGLGLSQPRQDYYNRIRQDRNRGYRSALQDYLLRYHKRTGNPDDELVAFDVYWLRDQCPPPGSDKPYDHERIPLLVYRKPGYRPRPGLPALPPAPQVRSAESHYEGSDRIERAPPEKTGEK